MVNETEQMSTETYTNIAAAIVQSETLEIWKVIFFLVCMCTMKGSPRILMFGFQT